MELLTKKENTLDKILVSWDCDHLPTLEMIDELSQNMVICALFVNCRKSQLVSHGRGEKGKFNFPPSSHLRLGRGEAGRGGVSESHLNMGRAGESRGGGSKQEEWDEQADRRRQVYTPVGARTLRWGHSWCLYVYMAMCAYLTML